jgi:hypothetical protein
MSEREDELLDQRHSEVLAAILGVHSRLDALNGRTRTLENKITILEERTPPSRIAAGSISAIVSGLISGLGMWVSNQK